MTDNRGVSLIEAVVVLGLLGILVSALVQLNLMLARQVAVESFSVRATAIAVETLEAVRALKDKDWNSLSNLTPGAVYYLSFSDSNKNWIIESLNPGKIQGAFERSFSVYAVSRDMATGKISALGGAADNDTLKVEATVIWNERGRDKNIKLTTYFTNF